MKRRCRTKGFSLMELIIVIGVIGVLLSVFIPVYSHTVEKSKHKSATSDAIVTLKSFVSENVTARVATDVVIFVQKPEGVYVFGYQASNGRLQYPAEYSFDVPSIDALIESEYNSKDGVFRLKTIVNSQQEKAYHNLAEYAPDKFDNCEIYEGYLQGTVHDTDYIPTFPVNYLPGTEDEVINLPPVVNVEAGGKHTIHGNYIARNDYMFDGWYDSSDPEITYIPGQIIRVTKPLTLVAKWVPVAEYTLTFDGNGGTVVLAEGLSDLTTKHLVGTNITSYVLESYSTLPGMTFRGWYCEDTIYNSDYTGSIIIRKDITFKAIWEKFTLTYDPGAKNVVNMPDPLTVEYDFGEPVTISTQIPFLTESAVFSYWNCLELGMNFAPGASIPGGMPMQNITLRAMWTAPKFTVIYQPGSVDVEVKGMISPSVVDINIFSSDEVYTLPANKPTAEGYRFMGWASSYPSHGGAIFPAGGSFPYDFTYTGDTVLLTAMWEKLYAVNYRRVTEDSVEIIQTTYHIANENVPIEDIMPDPYNAYPFAGWALRIGLDGPISDVYHFGNSFIMPADNVYLDSQWIITKYKITYYAGDGVTATNMPDETEMYSQNEIVTLSNMTPKREGYVFFAWLYETQPYKPGGKFIMPDHDVVLTASWVTTNTVIYKHNAENNGVKVPPNEKCIAHTEYVIPSMVPRYENKKWVFTGWLNSYDNMIYQPGAAFIMPEQDVTLTAQWISAFELTFATQNDENLGVINMPEPIIVRKNVEFQIPDTVIVRTDGVNKVFAYWQERGKTNGKKYYPGDIIKINKDITLDAFWGDPITITFDDGVSSQQIQVPETVQGVSPWIKYTVPMFEPQRPNYQFMGWKVTHSNGTNTSLGSNFIVTPGETFQIPQSTGLKLTAQWASSSDVRRYTVTVVMYDVINNEYAGMQTFDLWMLYNGGSFTLHNNNFTAFLPGYKPYGNFSQKFTSNSGSISLPYISVNVYKYDIIDGEEYIHITNSYGLQTGIRQDLSANYIQKRDIALYSYMQPIGYISDTQYESFTGKYDGDGHTISGFEAAYYGSSYIGLFSRNKGEIRNLNLIVGEVAGRFLVGGLCGQNDGLIYNCTVTSTWQIYTTEFLYKMFGLGENGEEDYRFASFTGGITGFNTGVIDLCGFSGPIKNMYMHVTEICGEQLSGLSGCIGGIAGYNKGEIERSWAFADINGAVKTKAGGTSTNGNWNYIGGLVGMNFGGTVSDCWSNSFVVGAYDVGGLVGANSGEVNNPWSYVRGLTCSAQAHYRYGDAMGIVSNQGEAQYIYYEASSACGLGTRVTSLKTGTQLPGLSVKVWEYSIGSRPQIDENKTSLANNK